MTTGIIYLAKNIISGKCYIGQTIRTLEIRKRQHLTTTIKEDYKFGRALQKYNPEDWVWSILTEVPVEKLNEYETFFINDLNCFKNGYNSNGGGNSQRRNTTIYELWHPEHGEIKETIGDLSKRYSGFPKCIHQLIKGKRHHINGYVLLKNKNKYREIVKIYDFYHPEVGVVTCTTKELFNKYRYYFKSKENGLNILSSRVGLIHFGWVLAENKNKYEDIINRSAYITLTHSEHGTLTLRRSEFIAKYKLQNNGLTELKNKNRKEHKGWSYFA